MHWAEQSLQPKETERNRTEMMDYQPRIGSHKRDVSHPGTHDLKAGFRQRLIEAAASRED